MKLGQQRSKREDLLRSWGFKEGWQHCYQETFSAPVSAPAAWLHQLPVLPSYLPAAERPRAVSPFVLIRSTICLEMFASHFIPSSPWPQTEDAVSDFNAQLCSRDLV